MNDLISREDALNFRVSRGLQEDGIVYVPMKEVKEYLRGLPSAEPRHNFPEKAQLSGEDTTSDCISRQAAIDGKIFIQRANGVEIYSDEAVPVEYLRALPSAQPEKCEDCGNFNKTRLVIPQPEQKKAKWKKSDLFEGMLSCSHCGTQRNPKFNLGLGSWNYCPNCGFEMEAEKDG